MTLSCLYATMNVKMNVMGSLTPKIMQRFVIKMVIIYMYVNVMIPGKYGPTITFVFPGATGFVVGLPIRLDCISFRALVTFPLFFTMFSAVMLFYAGEVS